MLITFVKKPVALQLCVIFLPACFLQRNTVEKKPNCQ